MTGPRRRRPPGGDPTHRQWEVLFALTGGRVVESRELPGGQVRWVVPPGGGSAVATPVPGPVALGLLARGWLARATPPRGAARPPPGDAVKVTRYRLSLRGWYALGRVRPDLPLGGRPGAPGGPSPPNPVTPTEAPRE